jgi:hypothetical protein
MDHSQAAKNSCQRIRLLVQAARVFPTADSTKKTTITDDGNAVLPGSGSFIIIFMQSSSPQHCKHAYYRVAHLLLLCSLGGY